MGEGGGEKEMGGMGFMKKRRKRVWAREGGERVRREKK